MYVVIFQVLSKMSRIPHKKINYFPRKGGGGGGQGSTENSTFMINFFVTPSLTAWWTDYILLRDEGQELLVIFNIVSVV